MLGAGGSPLPINLAAILAPAASRAWAAVLTRNRVTGAPVEIVRSHRGRPVRGIVINNKVANVCAPDGVAAARAVLDRAGSALGVAPEELLPASTGVIGWQLPVAAMGAAMPALALQPRLGDPAGGGARHHDHRRLPQAAQRTAPRPATACSVSPRERG